MAHSAQTLFFDIKRSGTLLFVELRTRNTGWILEPEEALKVDDLPDGFTIAPNPENPGKAAFTSSVHKGMMVNRVLQDAGFRYNAEDVAKLDARVEEEAKRAEEEEAAKSAPQADEGAVDKDDPEFEKIKKHFEALHPGHRVEGITIAQDGSLLVRLAENDPEPKNPMQPTPPTKLSEEDSVRFRVGTRTERADDGTEQPVVRVALEIPYDRGWWPTDNLKVADLPDFLSVDRSSRLYRSALSEAETRERLVAMGYIDEPRVFLWYSPDQLCFGVDPEGDDDGPVIILMPIPDRCDYDYELLPYEDDLNGDGLLVHPDFMGHDVMENTFELSEPLAIAEIKMRMIALGFTHNREFDHMIR